MPPAFGPGPFPGADATMACHRRMAQPSATRKSETNGADLRFSRWQRATWSTSGRASTGRHRPTRQHRPTGRTGRPGTSCQRRSPGLCDHARSTQSSGLRGARATAEPRTTAQSEALGVGRGEAGPAVGPDSGFAAVLTRMRRSGARPAEGRTGDPGLLTGRRNGVVRTPPAVSRGGGGAVLEPGAGRVAGPGGRCCQHLTTRGGDLCQVRLSGSCYPDRSITSSCEAQPSGSCAARAERGTARGRRPPLRLRPE
jgi:hypothetical protein